MDERLEKALAFSNYMVTFNNQKNIIKEKFFENLIHFENGFEFLVTQELLTFISMLVQRGHVNEVVLIDKNDLPVKIDNLEVFFDTLMDVYFRAANRYVTDYTSLLSKRSVEKLNDC